MKYTSHKSYTLTEVLVVVIIVGIIAGLAIPNFQRSMVLASARTATNNLVIIHGANMAYRAKFGGFWPNGGAQGVAAINANLNINILPESNVEYECSGNSMMFICEAASPSLADTSRFRIIVTENNLDVEGNINPRCTTGACPYN